jgi:2-oxoglutarate ferredoxin oxidoreductase subunit alpha
MQAKWGSHGDYEIIAYCPNSAQEMFNLTIKAFNMAEKYRTPTFVMSDQVVAHMTEKVVIPKQQELQLLQREKPPLSPAKFLPYDFDNDFSPMPIAGGGVHANVESLTHDEQGYPSTDHDVSAKMVEHLIGKIRNNANNIVEVEHYLTDDADIVIVAYGSTSRSAMRAVRIARTSGKKVGLLRLVTPWPFPSKEVERLGARAKTILVPEINYGQVEHMVREYTDCPVLGIHHAPGSLISPETICRELERL